MSVGDIWEVTLSQRLAGQRAVNVMHFGETVASSEPKPAKVVADMFITDFLFAWRSAVSEDMKFECVYVRRVQPIASIPYLAIISGPNSGLIASDSVPGNASACLSFHTDLNTKSGRGRMYVAGIPEAGQEAGLMDDVQMALMDNLAIIFADDTHSGLGGGVYAPAVYSRLLSQANTIRESIFSRSIATMSSRRQPFGMIP